MSAVHSANVFAALDTKSKKKEKVREVLRARLIPGTMVECYSGKSSPRRSKTRSRTSWHPRFGKHEKDAWMLVKIYRRRPPTPIDSAIDSDPQPPPPQKQTQEEKKERKLKAKQQAALGDLLDEKLWEHAANTAGAVSSWADCDTDDEDGGFGGGGLAPLPEDFKGLEDTAGGLDDVSSDESSSDEEEEDDMVKDDDDEEEEEEVAPREVLAPIVKAPEPEKTLSKKEQKAKELEELDAALLELGVEVGDETAAPATAGNMGGESKAAAKRRKKAERDAAQASGAGAGAAKIEKIAEAAAAEHAGPVDMIDPAEAKKILAAKMGGKKKTGGGGAAAAVAEAKARAAKSKKKGGGSKANHNQNA